MTKVMAKDRDRSGRIQSKASPVVVHANPTKAFFVRMITRDITLEDCILDLIDNSVDSAWKSAGSPLMKLGNGVDLSKYRISIVLSPEKFLIRDNCGGMTQGNAENYAFSFGKHESQNEAQYDKYSIGAYGIGMKRALFKLGKKIRIKSTYQEKNRGRHTFSVPISVNDWMNNKNSPWTFNLIKENKNLEKNGVEILANQLTDIAKSSFDDPSFCQNLRHMIARDYSIQLNRGLKILINGKPLKGLPIEFRRGVECEPVRLVRTDRVNSKEVIIEVVAGMVAKPPDDIAPDEKKASEKSYGWYIVCNGRIVLAADKTSDTGWGIERCPQWHRQYAGFIGVVSFTAESADVLPLTTTKRGVDLSSKLYLKVRRKLMHGIMKQWIEYTNSRKRADDKEKENKEAQKEIVPLHKVEKRRTMKLPKLTPASVPSVNVHYSVERSRMQKLSEKIGYVGMPYREVGIKSFDHTYKDFVGEE